jgi:hypothetical protein
MFRTARSKGRRDLAIVRFINSPIARRGSLKVRKAWQRDDIQCWRLILRLLEDESCAVSQESHLAAIMTTSAINSNDAAMSKRVLDSMGDFCPLEESVNEGSQPSSCRRYARSVKTKLSSVFFLPHHAAEVMAHDPARCNDGYHAIIWH